MKLLLSNNSPSLSIESQNNKIKLKWNTNIGIVFKIFAEKCNVSSKNNSFKENLKLYKTASFTFMLLSRFDHSELVSVSTNLIATNIFNPTGRLFIINTDRAVAYLNKNFIMKRVPLNDVFIDGFYFTFDIQIAKNQAFTLPNTLDFQIGIDFHE